MAETSILLNLIGPQRIFLSFMDEIVCATRNDPYETRMLWLGVRRIVGAAKHKEVEHVRSVHNTTHSKQALDPACLGHRCRACDEHDRQRWCSFRRGGPLPAPVTGALLLFRTLLSK